RRDTLRAPPAWPSASSSSSSCGGMRRTRSTVLGGVSHTTWAGRRLSQPSRSWRRPVGELDGLVAVVTGAGQGIGRAVARELADRGASVVVSDLRAEAAEATAAEIVGAG